MFSLIFTLALFVFLLALIKTDFALIMLIFSMLLSPEFKMGGVPGRAVVIRLDDILLFVVFFGWLAKMAIYKELGVIKTTILNRPIITYIFICIIATLLGVLQGYVKIKYSIFYILKYMEYFLLFFMVANNLKNVRQVKLFVYSMLVVCAIVSLYGWAQIGSGLRVTAPFEGQIGEANTLAGYLLLLMAIVMGLIMYPESRLQRFVLLALLGVIVVPFLYTLSRGAWLGFIITFFVFIIIHKKLRPYLILALLIFIMFASYIFPHQVRERVKETFTYGKTYTILGRSLTFDESTSARIDSWKEAFIKWQKRPLLGYGIPAGIVIDNQYARVLREVGLIGFLTFAWLMTMIFKVGWQAYQACQGNNFACGLSLGFIAGFVGLLTQALTAETFIIVRIAEPFWFLTAVIVGLPELFPSPKKESSGKI